uniref:Uncharacterized protein n=1 Tax=Permutotetraviridae sp. TaxID=2585115 RepID=A0A514DAE7_9VIRU|nr:MAG: hypothetical protein H2RhizoLitter8801_000002 [Permutotetraviridae sp.]
MPQQRQKKNATRKNGKRNNKNKKQKRTKLFQSGTQIMESAALSKSIANPFEYSACIPDGSRGVGCFSVKTTVTLSTGTGGTTYSTFVNPINPSGIYAVDTGGTAATPTYLTSGTWNDAPSGSTIRALYRSTRPVSAGIRVTYTGSTVNDSGVIFAGQFAANTNLSAVANGAALQTLANASMYYKTMPLRSGAVITWRPCDMDDLMNFTLPIASFAQNGSVAAPYIGIVAYGAAAGGVSSCQVELIVNYEGQYQQQSFMGGGINSGIQNPAEPGWFEKTLNLVRRIEPIVSYLTPWPQLMQTPRRALPGPRVEEM